MAIIAKIVKSPSLSLYDTSSSIATVLLPNCAQWHRLAHLGRPILTPTIISSRLSRLNRNYLALVKYNNQFTTAPAPSEPEPSYSTCCGSLVPFISLCRCVKFLLHKLSFCVFGVASSLSRKCVKCKIGRAEKDCKTNRGRQELLNTSREE